MSTATDQDTTEAATTLTDAAEELTQPQRREVERDNTTRPEWVTLPSLLEQTLDASGTGIERTGGRNTHLIPISPDAVQLVADIDRETRRTLGTYSPGSRRRLAELDIAASTASTAARWQGQLTRLLDLGVRDPSQQRAADRLRRRLEIHAADPSRLPPLVRQVRAWAAHAHEWRTTAPHYLTVAAALAASWVVRARGIVAPDPNRTRRHGAHCPQCAATTVWTIDDTGERVRSPAIQVDGSAGHAECLACHTVWPIHTWALLAQVLEQQRAETLTRSATLGPA